MNPNLDQTIAAAREAFREGQPDWNMLRAGVNLLAALDAQPIAGEVWQYRANSTSRGKEWIDCRDERAARDMEALGFEIRLLYAAPPAALGVPDGLRNAEQTLALLIRKYGDEADAAALAMLTQQPAAAVPAEVAPNPESADFKAGMALGRAESEFLAAAIKNPACGLCGATCEKDAETKCVPNGDSCPGVEWPLANLWALAQQPAAAVPEGYAAAIKAVQEMMPPRDFRPSAQVWLTGNQVNELHARLDAAAMLAAAREGES